MSLEKKLQTVPAKKLGLNKTLGIFLHLLFSKRQKEKHTFRKGIALTLAILVGLLGSTSVYAYSQPELKEGDMIYPIKLLAERTVALIKTDPVAKAEYYQQLADRRTYEAGLFLAHENVSSNFEFLDDIVKKRFLGTLKRADQLNTRALENTEKVANTESLESILENISKKQESQVEALNAMIDSLGLEVQKLEVDEVLTNLDEAYLRQQTINEVKEEIKDQEDIKLEFNKRLEQKRQYTEEELESRIQYHRDTLDKTIEELEESEVDNKEVILKRLRQHKEELEEFDSEDERFFGRTRALENYGMYKARQKDKAKGSEKE